MNRIFVMFVCVVALVALVALGACGTETVTTTVTQPTTLTTTVSQPQATVTATVTATATTTVTKTVTGTTATTTSPTVTTMTTSPSPTSPTTTATGTVTTPTTTFPGLFERSGDDTPIVSDDGKLQIISHGMSYNEGIHDVQGMYINLTLENLTSENVSYIITCQLYDNHGVITDEGDILYRKSIPADMTLDVEIQTFVMKAWFYTLQIETL